MSRADPNCKCESISIYDGKHRCKKCYQVFRPVPEFKYFVDPREAIIFDEAGDVPDEVWNRIGTRRDDNLPLGVKPNEPS